LIFPSLAAGIMNSGAFPTLLLLAAVRAGVVMNLRCSELEDKAPPP
jgi:hypothetical protein